MARILYVPEAGRALSFPDEMTDDQVVSFVRAKYPKPTPPPPPEEPVGALSSGFYGSLGRLEAAGGKAAQTAGLDTLSQYLYEQSKANEEYAAKYKPDVGDISQITGPTDVAKFAGSTIAQSLPETAIGIGGAYTGAGIGAAIGGPAAPVTAILGGIIGGALAALPFFVGGNLQRQAQEQGIPLEQTSGSAASVGAIAQAPLDAAFDALVARKLPGAGIAYDVAKKSFLGEIAKAVATEGLTEPAQQAIELAQANPDKLLEFGPEVQNEILNAAAGGALAGGVIGGAADVVGRVAAPEKTSEETLARQELTRDVTAGSQRAQEMRRSAEINAGINKLSQLETIGRLRLDKVKIDPTPENKLRAPVERYQISDFRGSPIADFSDPVNAVDAVNAYQRAVGKKITLQNTTTGGQVPTETPTGRPKVTTTQQPTTEAPAAPAIGAAPEAVATPEIKPTPAQAAPAELPEITTPAIQPSGEGMRINKVFKTALGSQYTLYSDGTTTRNKTPHPGHDPADVGVKPKSEATYYVRPEDTRKLDIVQAQNLPGTPAIVEYKPNVIGVKWMSGPQAGKFINDSLTKTFDQPSIGLTPIETWGGGTDIHFGNNITEVNDAPAIDPATQPAADVREGSAREAFALGPSDIQAVSAAEQQAVRKRLDDRIEKVTTGVRQALNRYGLKDVQTKFVPAFVDGLRVRATYGEEARIGDKSIITLATDIYNPDLTVEQLVDKVFEIMNHETIHSLSDLGLLRKNEFDMLANAAAKTQVPGKKYTYLDYAQSVYGKATREYPVYKNPEAIREEAIAEMFRDWRTKKLGAPPNVRGLINRVIETVRSIFSTMKRENYADVFRKIESGEVGARERGEPVRNKTTTKGDDTIVSRISAEPELPSLSMAPTYPYGQRVPEVNAAEMSRVEHGVEYGALVNMLDRLTNSRIGRTIMPERFRPDKATWTSFIQNFADKMLPLGQMVDYIKQNGGTVPDAFDVAMHEDLMRSRVGNQLEVRENDLYSPVFKFLKQSRITQQELEHYIYARHVIERNAQMRKINPPKIDPNTGLEIPYDPSFGSGMSDEEAMSILDDVASDPRQDDFLEGERLVRLIIDDTKRLRVESGLSPDFDNMVMEDENGNLVEVGNYKYYVPLRGFADESHVEGEVEEEMRARIGQGFKIRGREDMRAFGRTSRATDIIAHAILQNSEALIRAEKNKVGQSLLGLVTNNPELAAKYGVEVMTQGKKPLKKYISSKGVVKTMVDPMYKNSDSVMVVKVDGQEVPIKIENRFLQKALLSKRSGNPDVADKALGFLQSANRWLASVNTALNPEFMLVNFPRDLQTALINISQYDIDNIKSKVFKDSFKAIKSVYAILRNPEAQNDWSEWYKMFREDGGNTNGFFGTFTLEERLKEISKLAQDTTNSPSRKLGQSIGFIRDLLEDSNGAFENAIRLSVYKNSIEAGVPRKRAAQIAKNLTVNFDKRGVYGPLLNSLYLFYNASVQGSLAMAMAAGRSKKVRRAFGGLIIAGMIQDMLNSSFSDEDEDGKKIYDKIPDYKLESNIIIMDPAGITKDGYFSLPLPYGFNAFFNMGRALSRNLRGEYKTSEAVTSIGSTFVDAFNPIGGTESLLNFIAPTAVDPLVALTINQDFTGRRIYPEPFPGSVPKADSQLYWSTTSPIFKNVADFLNTATGGTEYVPGLIDWNPAVMEYIYDYATGGLGSFVRRTYDTATNTIPSALSGDLADLEVNDIPIFRKVYGNVSARMSFEDYFNKVNHVLARGQELKSAIAEGDPQRIASVRARFADELKIYPAVRSLSSRRNQLASELKKVRENEKMPPEAKRKRIEFLQKQIEDITNRVDILYEKNIDNKYPGYFS